MNKSVYLAGPIQHCTDEECNSWRNSLIEQLNNIGYMVYNPMTRDYRKTNTNLLAKKIVEDDKMEINISDDIIVNMLGVGNKPCIGTSMEIMYSYMLRKRILVVGEHKKLSPWVIYHATNIFPSFDSLMAFLKNDEVKDEN